jgi:ribosomal protein S18 acetylase RimI-like enzyme
LQAGTLILSGDSKQGPRRHARANFLFWGRGRSGGVPSGPTQIRIRDFVPTDRPFFERGLLTTLREEAPFDPLKLVVPPKGWGRTYSTFLQQQVRRRGGYILVAQLGRRRAGFVVGARQLRHRGRLRSLEPARPCWIFEVFVLPEFRRRGVGNALMGDIERRFRSDGRDFVHLLALAGNAGALSVYRARGYTQRVYMLGKWLTKPT